MVAPESRATKLAMFRALYLLCRKATIHLGNVVALHAYIYVTGLETKNNNVDAARCPAEEMAAEAM